MNQKLANMTMAERRELNDQIKVAHARGIRLDPQLVAEAKDSLILRKPQPQPVQVSVPVTEQPTESIKDQVNRLLAHWGKEPVK